MRSILLTERHEKRRADRSFPQERFLEKAANVANIILAGGGVVSLLALLYFFYHYGWTGERKFDSSMGVVLYYLVPAGVAGLLFASLKLKARYKINLAILSVSLAASVLGVELILELANVSAPELAVWQVQGQSKEKKQRTREFARQYGVDFDTRDGNEVVGELRKGGVDAVPMVSKWLDEHNDLWNWQPDGTIHSAVNIAGEEVIPLGAVANRLTVLCNESGQWITYPSDEHGFSNPKGIWQSNPLDIAALGDSFAQGYCVPPDKSFVALIQQRFAATLNLGMAGDGPLLEVATLKEYLPSLKPRHVLWFYYEGNDLTGLQTEKKIPLFMAYLKGEFHQGLMGRQRDIDQALIAFIDRQTARKMNQPPQPPPQRRNWISKGVSDLVGLIALGSLKQKLGLVQGRTPQEAEQLRRELLQKAEELADFEGPNMDLFSQILVETKSRVNAWGGTLDFVYLPSSTRYFGSAEVPLRMRARVLSAVSALGIPVIDIHSAFQAHGDVRSLFPWGGYGHYNEKGHRVVAEEVLKAIDASGRSVPGALYAASRTS
jgi:lysophospholipase L1-like esterase